MENPSCDREHLVQGVHIRPNHHRRRNCHSRIDRERQCRTQFGIPDLGPSHNNLFCDRNWFQNMGLGSRGELSKELVTF